VCGRGCLRFRYGHPPILQVVAPPTTNLKRLRKDQQLEGLNSEVDLQ